MIHLHDRVSPDEHLCRLHKGAIAGVRYVPSSAGHKYTTRYVESWNTVLRPSGLIRQMLTRLKRVISAVG